MTLNKKGETMEIKTIELKPIRDMKKIRGKFDDLISAAERTEDYVQITLTDEEDIPNAMSRLQTVYKNALELRYDNTRTRENSQISCVENIENKTTFELFSEFFAARNNTEMDAVQKQYMQDLIEKIEEEEA